MAYSTFRANVPQLQAHVDRSQTKSMGIPLSNVFDTLQANMGSVYVNDFNKFGRTYQVRVQADAPYRAGIDDILRLEVRNDRNEMVPLGTVVEISETLGPQIITRYNMYPSAKISGQGTRATSSGESMEIMERLANEKLPASMGFEWTGMSFQEKAAAGQTLLVFVLAVSSFRTGRRAPDIQRAPPGQRPGRSGRRRPSPEKTCRSTQSPWRPAVSHWPAAP